MSGKVTQHALMNPWSVPVANLHGAAIRYRNAPSGLVVATAADLDRAMQDTRFLMPTLKPSVTNS